MSECGKFGATVSRVLFVLSIALSTSAVNLGNSGYAGAQSEQYNRSVSPENEGVLEYIDQASQTGDTLIAGCVAGDLNSCNELNDILSILHSFCYEGYKSACVASEDLMEQERDEQISN